MTLPIEVTCLPWWRQPSFAMVLVLAISLALYPFADVAHWLHQLVQLMDIVAVLMVVRVLRHSPVIFQSGWIISLPLMAAQIAFLIAPESGTVALVLHLLQVIFHGFAVLALMSYVLRDYVITLDELFALAAVYILLALMWASAYAVILQLDTSAIFINASNNPKGYVSFADLVYYSMTTLTSTGYGEITPVTPAARALSLLQQWLGVMFVAIVIARLTSLYRPSGSEN
jgi:hypothetical protein